MFRKWKKGHHLDPAREKTKDEIYAFKKTLEHGFPNQPSAFAFDQKLKLMAIGTKNGALKVFGAPGVEFTGVHAEVNQVVQLHFLAGEGRLVSILDDNTMHLWEITEGKNPGEGQTLSELNGYQLSGRPGLNQITEVMVKSTNQLIWIGTEGGGIYPLSLPDFDAHDGGIIHQDQVMQSIPDSYKTGKALGPVEALAEHPQDSNLVLIGYSRGLIVLWNTEKKTVERCYLGNLQLEALAWNSNGHEFMSSHSDGSWCIWQLNPVAGAPLPTPHIPYGPFPCKAIIKLYWKTSRTHPYIIFNGGMPRANYGDRHCVSVICGLQHVTFDVTSRIIDVCLVCENSPQQGPAAEENPTFMLILAEEELIAIDLQKEGWPVVPPPYLAPLHSSPITCSAHVASLSSVLWEKIKMAQRSAEKSIISKSKTPSKISFDSDWPVIGGSRTNQPDDKQHDILLTGHENGMIKLWDASGVSLCLLLKIQTSPLFNHDGENDDHDNFEDEYPPFRKIGEFDPYSDDPRLGIRKLAMCPQTGTMVAGGTAGQVIVYVLSEDSIETTVTMDTVDILGSRTGFTWKGHDKLEPKENHISMDPGYQVSNLVQCVPPGSVTAINVQAHWGLVGFGTGHGLALFDYQQSKSVLTKCTLETTDGLAMEGNFSRIKSLKMSLRQSFTRLRGSFKGGSKRRMSGRRRYRRDVSKKLQEANKALVDEEETASHHEQAWPPQGQRKIEARGAVEDGMAGITRCVYFANTYFTDTSSLSPTFWAGTNRGCVYAYVLHVPDYSKRQEHEVTYLLGKEIQLMHKAPIMDITVIDQKGAPVHLTFAGKLSSNGSPPSQQQHSLLISSEEQFKIFSLPKLSSSKKLKMTAVSGELVRKICFSRFQSSTSREYHEYGMVCLTNTGELHVFSTIPSLKSQVQYKCIEEDDPHGIQSTILTTSGHGFYLISPSEYERFSMSTVGVVESHCSVAMAPASPVKTINVQVAYSDPQESLPKPNIPKSPTPAVPALDVSDLSLNKSPPKSSKKKKMKAGSLISPSHKQPLLEDHDDEVASDDEHLAHTISVLEEAEKTLAAANISDHSQEINTEVNVQELLGTIEAAEKNLALN